MQDDLDDNTYEYVRRYLSALTSFTGGLLPFPYDPRHLILRQTLSPITGTTDVQSCIRASNGWSRVLWHEIKGADFVHPQMSVRAPARPDAGQAASGRFR